ncbi:MAG: hypothetical protein QGH45_20110, partial [Myxococcota bacterium]|nr:hypothetical protein [Myxococcota bacterium]
MRRTLPPVVMVTLGLLAGCPVEPTAADDGECGSWISAQRGDSLDGERLAELSGLAASHRYPDVLWAINDGGHAPAVYAIDREGLTRGAFSLAGVEAEDWEDLAVGPCPAAAGACSCLYVADTGDNERVRETGVILRFPEPDLEEEGSVDGVATGVEALWFAYPGERHDAEALLVDPGSGEVVVVTKAMPGEQTAVFAFPTALPAATTESAPAVLDEVALLDLEHLDDLDSPRVTAGDASPRGI